VAGSKVFIIEEQAPLGGQAPPGGLQRFEWTAAKRSIPKGSWTFGGHQRTVRTDYPGANDPTEQVLGPNFTPFTLTGTWDDRYNPKAPTDPDKSGPENRASVGGYATEEMARFEAMCMRGNPVRITFQRITVQGVITDWDFEFRRDWDIDYSFTVSPHHRQPGGFFALKRSPRAVLNAKQLRSEVGDEISAALALHERVPYLRLSGTTTADAEVYLDEWEAGLDAIDTAIEQRNLTLETDPASALLRLAAAFLGLSTTAQNLIDLLRPLDSTEALDFDDQAISVLDFDAWARGLMFQSRRVVVFGQRAAAQLRQRAHPNAIALYRPQEGEHLYSVSNRFFGTPFNWRIIQERNGLISTSLTGEELLIIPEVTER